jgi:predicted transcriptional regulator
MLTTSEISDVDTALEVLSDKYHRRILYSIIEKPKSVFDISTECDMLQSTVYRKLKDLKNYRLVNIKCEIKPDGKKRFLYHSKIRAIYAAFDRELNVKVVPNC